ncbi:MAG TPA: hypothetical protein PK299_10775 [Anaerolineales bacterium]|nr:hypothetical protein [Anaerolineales bacterium]
MTAFYAFVKHLGATFWQAVAVCLPFSPTVCRLRASHPPLKTPHLLAFV